MLQRRLFFRLIGAVYWWFSQGDRVASGCVHSLRGSLPAHRAAEFHLYLEPESCAFCILEQFWRTFLYSAARTERSNVGTLICPPESFFCAPFSEKLRASQRRMKDDERNRIFEFSDCVDSSRRGDAGVKRDDANDLRETFVSFQRCRCPQ